MAHNQSTFTLKSRPHENSVAALQTLEAKGVVRVHEHADGRYEVVINDLETAPRWLREFHRVTSFRRPELARVAAN